jgi:hypothetical protein
VRRQLGENRLDSLLFDVIVIVAVLAGRLGFNRQEAGAVISFCCSW